MESPGDDTRNVDDFVTYDDTKIKWSRDLKLDLQRAHYAEFKEQKMRSSLYRPFCKAWLFFDRILNEEVYQFSQIYPDPSSEEENQVIIVGGYGRKNFAVMISNQIPNLNFYADPAQCFPYYTYTEDGSYRRENITDWILTQVQTQYGTNITKRDIFSYVYAMLHHPLYRERYTENLKYEMPRIPLISLKDEFETCLRIGKQLMALHLYYEQAAEYPLRWIENREIPINLRIEKMRLTPNKDAVVVNKWLTIAGIPHECFTYRLGNRSALEWVIDQYRVREDKRSGIVSDPNREDDPEYTVRLVGRVVTVSVETVRLVEELAREVKQEDWMGETVG